LLAALSFNFIRNATRQDIGLQHIGRAFMAAQSPRKSKETRDVASSGARSFQNQFRASPAAALERSGVFWRCIRKKLISLAKISMVSGLTFATARDQTPDEMSGRQRAQYANLKRSIGCRRPKLALHRVVDVEDLFGGRLKSPANGSEGNGLW
jgi:hypothetical protein